MHPILLKTQSFTFYTYGLCVALAMTLALALTFRRSIRAGISWSDALDLLFILFVAGLAGSRLAYVAQNWDYFRSDPWNAVRIQEGGLVWYGGFWLGLACGFVYCAWKKQSVLFWMDFFAPTAALAHAVGRMGCFLNGCCTGRPTTFFLCVRFPEDGFSRHPVQLYEAALLTMLGCALLILNRKQRRPGQIFGVYLLGYGVIRFMLEFLRDGQALFVHLTLPQWISLALIAVSPLFFMKTRQK